MIFWSIYVHISGNPYNIWHLQNEFSNRSFCLHISSHLVWKMTTQVNDSSTATSPELQEQVEVGDEVQLVVFLGDEIEFEQKCAA